MNLQPIIERLYRDLSEPVAVDIETTGFGLEAGDVVRGIAVGVGDDTWYLPLSHPNSPRVSRDGAIAVIEAVRSHDRVLMHNSPFDRTGLRIALGIEFEDSQIWDTLTVDWIINETADHRLKEGVGVRLFGIDAKAEKDGLDEIRRGERVSDVYQELRLARLTELGADRLPPGEGRSLMAIARDRAAASRRDWATFTYEDIEAYARQDVRLTLDVHDWQQDFIAQNPEYGEGLEREFRVDGLAYRLRRQGIRVDIDKARAEYELAVAESERLASGFPGVNLKSTPQVRTLLYETWALPATRFSKKTQQASTDKHALAALSYFPGVADLLAFREATKVMGAFYGPLVSRAEENLAAGGDGRVHPSWNAHRPVTGRWSCSEPNMQQTPREGEVKHCFIPDPGYVFVHADLPNAELRLAAILAKETLWLEAFRRGDDLHQIVADAAGITRQAGKVQNYQNLYGGGPKKLAETLALATGKPFPLGEAKKMWRAYWAAVPRVRRLMDALGEAWVRRGRLPIRPWPGRFRHRENLLMGIPEPSFKALNAIIQGSIAELVKDWMLELEARLPENWYLVAQIHDALVLMVPIGMEVWAQSMLQDAWDAINPFTELAWKLDVEIGAF